MQNHSAGDTPSHPEANVEGSETRVCGTEVNGGVGGMGMTLPPLLLPPQSATSVTRATTARPRRASI
jgi:hypothetical protein